MQIEYGYDGDFKAKSSAASQAATLSINYSATPSLLVELAHDNVAAQTHRGAPTGIGLGNAYLGVQYTLAAEDQGHPSFAVAYQATAPTGSREAGLTTGGFWHKTTVLVSKEAKGVTYDLNTAALLNNFGQGAPSIGGVQAALALLKNVSRRVGLQAEISGQTRDADEPRGAFVSSTLTYQPNTRWQWDVGVRAGLTSAAPRIGLFAGFTRAVSFKKRDGPSSWVQ